MNFTNILLLFILIKYVFKWPLISMVLVMAELLLILKYYYLYICKLVAMNFTNIYLLINQFNNI